jgi:hypothetical protein
MCRPPLNDHIVAALPSKRSFNEQRSYERLVSCRFAGIEQDFGAKTVRDLRVMSRSLCFYLVFNPWEELKNSNMTWTYRIAASGHVIQNQGLTDLHVNLMSTTRELVELLDAKVSRSSTRMDKSVDSWELVLLLSQSQVVAKVGGGIHSTGSNSEWPAESARVENSVPHGGTLHLML